MPSLPRKEGAGTNVDDARHVSGHGTSRSGGEIVEGLRRRSKAFEGVRRGLKGSEGVRRGSKVFEGVRRSAGVFEGFRGASKGRGDLRGGLRRESDSRGGEWGSSLAAGLVTMRRDLREGVARGRIREWNGMEAVVNDTGLPRVFLAYPYPYPLKPVPAWRVRVFTGV